MCDSSAYLKRKPLRIEHWGYDESIVYYLNNPYR